MAYFALGCFWGAEKLFWNTPGVTNTAVGYAGGFTPNPTYQEVCSARTGHTEIVKVSYDPAKISYEKLLRIFFEDHDPTQGMRQGNDVGTQYRSAIYTTSPDQLATAQRVRDEFQTAFTRAGYGRITTEIARPASSTRRGLSPAVPGKESLRLLPGACHWSDLQLNRCQCRLAPGEAVEHAGCRTPMGAGLPVASVESVPGEGIALVRVAGLEALSKPLTPHRSRPVSPGFRRDLALHLLLNSVVADGLRRVHCSVEIVLGDFADRALRILGRTPEPHAGVTVGLQLEPDRWRGGPGALAAALHLAHDAGLVLDVMAELMGEHIRLSGVATLRSELAGQLIEESKIEIDRRVGWTVERSDCGTSHSHRPC